MADIFFIISVSMIS